MCHFDCIYYGNCEKEIDCKDCDENLECASCTGNYCEETDK